MGRREREMEAIVAMGEEVLAALKRLEAWNKEQDERLKKLEGK